MRTWGIIGSQAQGHFVLKWGQLIWGLGCRVWDLGFILLLEQSLFTYFSFAKPKFISCILLKTFFILQNPVEILFTFLYHFVGLVLGKDVFTCFFCWFLHKFTLTYTFIVVIN